MWLLPQTLVALLGVAAVSALPKTCHAPELPLPLRQIYRFPSFPTYLESIYVRSNGDLLAVTAFPDASLYYLTGVTKANDPDDPPTVTLIRAFDEVNTLTSIIETQPDIFTIVAGNTSTYATVIPGTFGVWELDLRPTKNNSKQPPQAREIVRIAGGGFMTGMDTISPTTVLVSDGSNGLVWRVDLTTGAYDLAIQVPAMHYPPWASAPVGVNDINIHNGYLYWSNAFAATLSRIRLTDDGYAAAGAESELVAEVRSIFLDKFTFGGGNADGKYDRETIWAMTNADSRVLAITPEGEILTVAGQSDQMTVAGSTTGAFGKVKGDTKTLYVLTGGGINFPINGSMVEPGKIVAIDTEAFW
ncbi:hypothetical protein ASPACDRAFT_62667 [Aspergillus aculeatus ATCC 16872]|uniref:SMP-30/Gluconolactonase/LRE-like region domain-containing protein n=1 Tax=Aspergillus aculeatus (strain ATCC 16872 / CBS 172.66 / WB 5094) TaxID=690307 RepID=A0A1L9WNF2_ASPA1|nr:uncharacterized protein ASPACDRAFT_62667 [Aspergillus aculeatus ATCC 16872]OJJ97694.1 hypothetical protein ASPACDRAFT_62667 [Aspergillus aculeatus ATCC 16872]